jgi:hypothetical protein
VLLIVTIPLIIIEVIIRTNRITINKYAVYGFLVIILVGLVSLLHPNFHLSNIFQTIIDNHDIYVANSRSGQLIHYVDLQSNIWSIGYYFPLAIWSGLFRMGIWEANQLVEYLVGFENLVLLLFTISAVLQLPKLKSGPYNLLVLSAVLYVILLTGFLAMSAPNLGTLARYKVGFLPVFVILISLDNSLLTYLKSKFSTKVEDISE